MQDANPPESMSARTRVCAVANVARGVSSKSMSGPCSSGGRDVSKSMALISKGIVSVLWSMALSESDISLP